MKSELKIMERIFQIQFSLKNLKQTKENVSMFKALRQQKYTLEWVLKDSE